MPLAARATYKPEALRDLEHLPRDVQLAFRKAREALLRDPTHPARNGVDAVRYEHGSWRLKVGEYRAIYYLLPGLVVDFYCFGERNALYSRFKLMFDLGFLPEKPD
ncbi:MAG: type II toxin-antitoxin system RelE/ParE family toxin [Euryarchaeota archaeon]|nr:type II toxin-antitoxin system RelE/ParE family toxin [Euryarchaeota archaeon]MDE1836600.1 type II toxin-antitoxin system RelE/ParE family toxin [Euryarchaeota archaeon]MDE1879205.1 type II toxin-antitoxin system RelE/ParE family toxin [Euryarchaeota archaeon]MDE2044570.1 type II toxin-antitoxin system RelE/ParE family toxin [Thermoplasmata archaeon]